MLGVRQSADVQAWLAAASQVALCRETRKTCLRGLRSSHLHWIQLVIV